jgi:hypothetical protein
MRPPTVIGWASSGDYRAKRSNRLKAAAANCGIPTIDCSAQLSWCCRDTLSVQWPTTSTGGQYAGSLRTRFGSFSVVVMVAPELYERAVLDAQHQDGTFTLERLIPDATGQFD